MPLSCRLLAFFAVLAATSDAAWAQYGSISGSSGMFSSRTLGQPRGGAARSFSGGGRNTGMGIGTGMGLGSGMGSGMGLGGSSFGNAQFRFATRRQGDFVGADLRDINPSILGGLTGTTGAASSGSAPGTAGSSALNGTMGTARQGASAYRNSSRRSRFGNYGTGTTSQGPAVRLDKSFEVEPMADDQLSAATTKALFQAMRLPPGAPMEVSVQGGTAILRGVVATPHDRALAEQLVLLEPGIVRVANELEVNRTGATLGKAPVPGSPRPSNSESSLPR